MLKSRGKREKHNVPFSGNGSRFAAFTTRWIDEAAEAFKKGDKIQVEIVAREGDRFTLRAIETGQEDILHEGCHLPWEIGRRLWVTIVSIDPDGRIKKIKP